MGQHLSCARPDMTGLEVLGIGMLTGLVLVVLGVAVYNGSRNRLRDTVARARPRAAIIPAFAESPLPSTLVITVLDDQIEVWDRGGRPRASIALTGATISLRRVQISNGSYIGLRIEQGTDSVSFVPHYSATIRTADLERALRELGEDPAEHLGP